ncbi:MFS multidrug transporter [Aspergillus sp. HF37]|nr:MFS multidrug transporter [Aspergillus sp. HF37]
MFLGPLSEVYGRARVLQLSNLFYLRHRRQRGKAVAIYTLASLLGPIAGPIAGGFIAQTTTWRWVFWAISIAAAAIQLLGLFFLQETYTPILLQRRTARLGLATTSSSIESDNARPGPGLGILDLLCSALPIVQLIALYAAYLFGMLYLRLSTFPGVWEGVYPGIGGLNYIALGVGYMLGNGIFLE